MRSLLEDGSSLTILLGLTILKISLEGVDEESIGGRIFLTKPRMNIF
jgi:hypothetical protein